MPIIPEGGIPTHLALRATGSDLVLHAEGATVRFCRRSEWEAQGPNAPTIATLTRAQAIALSGFVRYWLEDDTEGFVMTSDDPLVEFRH